MSITYKQYEGVLLQVSGSIPVRAPRCLVGSYPRRCQTMETTKDDEDSGQLLSYIVFHRFTSLFIVHLET